MIRVIIVDDEILARIGMQSLLENHQDICVVGTFGTAQDALEFLSTNLVDIVITDIEMPQMNGLEFIREIRDKKLAEGIIILSCYDSFEYAQSAIALGINGYILKQEISREIIEKKIYAVADKIQELNSWRRQKMEQSDQIPENETGIKITGVVRLVNDFEKSVADEKMLYHLLDEIVSHYHMGWFLDSKRREPFIVFQFQTEAKEEERKEILERYVETIKKNILQYTNQKSFFGFSREFTETQEIPRSYEEAVNAADMMFYYENNTVFYNGDIQWSDTVGERMFSDGLLSENGIEVFREELTGFLHECKQKQIRVKLVKDILIQSVSILMYDILRSYLHDAEKIALWLRRYPVGELVSVSQTASLAKKGILGMMEQFAKELREYLTHRDFAELFDYIEQNMGSGFTVEELAERNNMSISAFTKKFKDITNMSPVQYINQRKVEKVKEYLKREDYTLNEIAEITGFSNENYMVRVFKKVTGKTITDFRKTIEMVKSEANV